MTQLRKMLRRIVYVPAALVILCTAVSGLLLDKTFVSGKDDGLVAYIAYGLSAYYCLSV